MKPNLCYDELLVELADLTGQTADYLDQCITQYCLSETCRMPYDVIKEWVAKARNGEQFFLE